MSGRNLFYFPEVQIKHPHPLAPSSSPFKSLFNVSLFTANHFSPLLMMVTLEPAANRLVSCQPLSVAHFC